MNHSSRIAVVLVALVLGLNACLATPSAWLGPAAAGASYPAGEEDRQFAMLARDLKQRAHFQHVAGETSRREALIWDTDRDPLDVLLRRTEALLAGKKLDAATIEIAVASLKAELDPLPDLTHTPETKRHLATVLMRRLLQAAAASRAALSI